MRHSDTCIDRLGPRIPIQGSCGASLNGEFWIIGGWNEGRQVFTAVNRIGGTTLDCIIWSLVDTH